MKPLLLLVGSLLGSLAAGLAEDRLYPDDRSVARLRMKAEDAGVVLKYSREPGRYDSLGARDLWIYQSEDKYYLHYDGAGPAGWLACLATSTNLVDWEKQGPVLDFGKPGESDSASASYGTTYFDGTTWHMFYLGTPHASPAPNYIPMFPYLTMKAKSHSPAGPWIKQPGVIPFTCVEDTYYDVTASPGHIIRQGEEFMMFFSAASQDQAGTHRTLSIARTRNLDQPWKVDAQPILSAKEQIENTSLYFEPANGLWFLFCNHIGLRAGEGEYTDAVWVYWTRDLNHWDSANKAVVLDGSNCRWSSRCIGLPGVVKRGNRLAVLYDAPGGESTSHMKRDIGLAWLTLPLEPPR